MQKTKQHTADITIAKIWPTLSGLASISLFTVNTFHMTKTSKNTPTERSFDHKSRDWEKLGLLQPGHNPSGGNVAKTGNLEGPIQLCLYHCLTHRLLPKRPYFRPSIGIVLVLLKDTSKLIYLIIKFLICFSHFDALLHHNKSFQQQQIYFPK